MQKRLSAIGVLFGFLLIAPTLWAQNGGFEPSPHIYKIKAADCETEPNQRVQSGFRVKDQVGIFTALHGVVGCKILIAEASGNGQTFHDLLIGKVDIRYDTAVLWSEELNLAPLVGLETITKVMPIDLIATYQVIGYPFGLFRQKPMVDVKILERTALGNLLPDDAINIIAERDSPAIDAQVFSVQAHLVPGHSGAPVLDKNGQVVGMGNGGLDLGRVEMGWAIPWDSIDPQAVSAKVSQTVSWTDFRKLRDLSKSESGLAFSYSTPEPPTPKPSTSTPIPTASNIICPFWLQIIDDNLKPIRGAQVKVIYGLDSVEDFSNSDGEYRGEIACEKGSPSVVVEVSADNFLAIEKNVHLTTSRIRIKLLSIISVATPTPIFRLQSTATAVQLPFQDSACAPIGAFSIIWQAHQDKLGCHISDVISSPITSEAFENGYLVWVKYSNLIYVLPKGRQWSQNTNMWDTNENNFLCTEAQQFGYPAMGFGKLWCLTPSVKAALGNPTDGEKPYEFAQQQVFEGGFVFEIFGGTRIILFENGNWRLS